MATSGTFQQEREVDPFGADEMAIVGATTASVVAAM
jgi:hypothetical protein